MVLGSSRRVSSLIDFLSPADNLQTRHYRYLSSEFEAGSCRSGGLCLAARALAVPGVGMVFPWRYPLPAVRVLCGFPAGSFTVAPQLGEDAPPARAARLRAALRSRSRTRSHRSHRV